MSEEVNSSFKVRQTLEEALALPMHVLIDQAEQGPLPAENGTTYLTDQDVRLTRISSVISPTSWRPKRATVIQDVIKVEELPESESPFGTVILSRHLQQQRSGLYAPVISLTTRSEALLYRSTDQPLAARFFAKHGGPAARLEIFNSDNFLARVIPLWHEVGYHDLPEKEADKVSELLVACRAVQKICGQLAEASVETRGRMPDPHARRKTMASKIAAYTHKP